MHAIATAILLCVLLEACGSKGALVMPPKPGAEQQQSNKQN
jgi:predicted small lipoprotein YifL